MMTYDPAYASLAAICIVLKCGWLICRYNDACKDNQEERLIRVNRSGTVITSPPRRTTNPNNEEQVITIPKLEDFSQSVEMNVLTNRELKDLLKSHKISTDGVLEREELLILAMTLWERHYSLKAIVDDVLEDAPAEKLCKICMHGPLDCVILNCGHITCCMACGLKLTECPVCRREIVRVIRTFKS